MENILKFKISTAIIIGGIIFLASFFATWITQSKELGIVQSEQKILGAIVGVNSNRILVLEQCILSTKAELIEIKINIKEIQNDQKMFYSKMDKKGNLPK